MIELLIADVDGTLVTPDKISTERARSAVRNLRAANVKFAIVSGRPARGMAMLVEPLGLTTPIAGFNGGMFVKPNMTPIDLKTLGNASTDVQRTARRGTSSNTQEDFAEVVERFVLPPNSLARHAKSPSPPIPAEPRRH